MAVKGATKGVVPQVLKSLENISRRLGKDVVITTLGGRRKGSINTSPHHSGIAADVYVQGLTTVEMASELVEEGFTGVGEYYKANGHRERFAHGDIRGLHGSERSGAYARGGKKGKPLCWYRPGPSGTKYVYGRRKSGGPCRKKRDP